MQARRSRRSGALYGITLAGIVLWGASQDPPSGPSQALAEAYRAKLDNPRYLEWKNRSGLPTGYQDFPEEARIKEARAALARDRGAPEGATVRTIPLRDDGAPAIDGTIGSGEWSGALELSLGGDLRETRLYLLSDGAKLYIAADAPGDTTTTGWDQLRFHYHIGVSPLIVNERIHVGSGERLTAIRQTTVRWTGPPPETDDERWKRFPVSDWQIYREARGASAVGEHRQYEAVVDLAEAGLPLGTPFAAFAEVETDPVVDDRGRRTRAYLGRLGSQDQPVWFAIREPAPSRLPVVVAGIAALGVFMFLVGRALRG